MKKTVSALIALLLAFQPKETIVTDVAELRGAQAFYHDDPADTAKRVTK